MSYTTTTRQLLRTSITTAPDDHKFVTQLIAEREAELEALRNELAAINALLSIRQQVEGGA